MQPAQLSPCLCDPSTGSRDAATSITTSTRSHRCAHDSQVFTLVAGALQSGARSISGVGGVRWLIATMCQIYWRSFSRILDNRMGSLISRQKFVSILWTVKRLNSVFNTGSVITVIMNNYNTALAGIATIPGARDINGSNGQRANAHR
jgi:hypothetical protein